MWLLEDGAECWDPRLPLQKLIEYGQGSFIRKYYIVIIKESIFRI